MIGYLYAMHHPCDVTNLTMVYCSSCSMVVWVVCDVSPMGDSKQLIRIYGKLIIPSGRTYLGREKGIVCEITNPPTYLWPNFGWLVIPSWPCLAFMCTNYSTNHATLCCVVLCWHGTVTITWPVWDGTVQGFSEHTACYPLLSIIYTQCRYSYYSTLISNLHT